MERKEEKSRKHEEREQPLYGDIANDLERLFRPFGSCSIYPTYQRMPREVKQRLEKDALYYIRVEKLVPDLMGYFQPNEGTKIPHRIQSGLIIVEVKSGPPRIRHIYQTKMYSEVFNSQNPFLITDADISVEMMQFLSDHSHILNTSVGYSRVSIGTHHPSKISVGGGMTAGYFGWYHDNPFSLE